MSAFWRELSGFLRSLAVFVLGATAACVTTPPAQPPPELLFGSWEWVHSTGGLAGTEITPASRGVHIRFRFERDGTLQVFHDGALTEQTEFEAGVQPGRAGAPPVPVLRYAEPVNVYPPPLREQYYRFQSPDTLVLGDTCPDCFDHLFARVP